MIYTSYWGRLKALKKAGIEPVAVSRGKPEGFTGRSFDFLAPTWAMVSLPMGPEFRRLYEGVLKRCDPGEVVAMLGDHDTALLCWERDVRDCHRMFIGEWLNDAGYECKEFDPDERRREFGTLPLF